MRTKIATLLMILFMAVLLNPGSSFATGSKISDLPSGAPLLGTDAAPFQRGAGNVKGSVDNVKDYILDNVTTDNITEGSTNKYFSNEVIDDRVNTLLQDSYSIGATYNDGSDTLSLDIKTAFTGDNTCTTDVTDAAETFAASNGGLLTLTTGCYRLNDYDGKNIVGVGDVTIGYNKGHSAVLYEPTNAEIHEHEQDITQVIGKASVNDNRDYAVKIKVSDASGYTSSKWAHVWAHVGIPPGDQSPQEITSITNANPAVVTYVGSDPSNGDIVSMFSIHGMTDFVNRAVKVANVNSGANTFEINTLAGAAVNTTNYEVYTKGGWWYENTASWGRITAFTNASTANMTLSSSLSLANGDFIICRGVVGANELNRRVFKVANLSGSSFDIQTIAGNVIDSTNWGVLRTGVGECAETGGLITNITAANPPVVSTNKTTGLTSGDIVCFEDTNGVAGFNKTCLKTANVVADTSFEVTYLDGTAITGTSIGTYKALGFWADTDRWVGESSKIVAVDTANNYIYLAGLRYLDYYKQGNDPKIAQYKEEPGLIKNVKVKALDDTKDPSVWWRPHAVDISGVPGMRFDSVRGGKLFAGLTICRSCPGASNIGQVCEHNDNREGSDPYTGSGKSISAITKSNPARITATSHGYTDGQHFTIRNEDGMAEISEGSFVADVIDANTIDVYDLKTLAPVNSTSYGTFTGSTMYKSTEIVVTAVDTATDQFTVASTSGFSDRQGVYVHVDTAANLTGDAALLHNTIWFMDVVDATHFKLYSTAGATNAVYFDITSAYTANSIRVADADVNALTYCHSTYGPGAASFANGFNSEGMRHPLTTDGAGLSWSSSTYWKIGQTTDNFYTNVFAINPQGPAPDEHEEAWGNVYSNFYVRNTIRGDAQGSYSSVKVAQFRGVDNTIQNSLFEGSRTGINIEAVNHDRISYNKVRDVTISNTSDMNEITGTDYAFYNDNLSSMFNKQAFVLEGTININNVGKPIYLDDFGAMFANSATINVKSPGLRFIDLQDSAIAEIGEVNLDYSDPTKSFGSGRVPFYTSDGKGTVLRIGKVNIKMGCSSYAPSSSGLLDTGTTQPYARVSFGSIKITNPCNLTIPPIVSSTDYATTKFEYWGPDTIQLDAGDETTVLTNGTSKACLTVTRPFLPLNWVAQVRVVDATQALTFDVNKNGTSVFGTNKISIDTSEKSSLTAATRFDAAAGTVAAFVPGDELCYDIDTATPVLAAGAKITIQGYAL
jgi:hypothetical protein